MKSSEFMHCESRTNFTAEIAHVCVIVATSAVGRDMRQINAIQRCGIIE